MGIWGGKLYVLHRNKCKEMNVSFFFFFSHFNSVCEATWQQHTLLEYPQLFKLQVTHVAMFINTELRYIACVLVLKGRLFPLNHSYASPWYYEMGFLPMLKETADVSVPLWYEKFNLKGWEKEWCTAYFHSLTLRDMRMMFYCVEEMMPIVLQRNSLIIEFNFF